MGPLGCRHTLPRHEPHATSPCRPPQDVIEPVLKPQWWVSCKDMAAASCQAVRDGSLEIIPKVCGEAAGRRREDGGCGGWGYIHD